MPIDMKYTVTDVGNGMKIAEFMTTELQLSTRFCKKASKEKRLRLNGKTVDLGTRISTKDVIEIIKGQQEHQDFLPEPMGLTIIYEDDDLLVVNKPPFLLVHPTPNHPTGTLTNGLLHHFQTTGKGEIVRLVTRLDRDTSGLVLVAKNTFAHMKLAKAMEVHEIYKGYQAIVHGHLQPPSGTIDLPLGKSPTEPHKQCVSGTGQPSITHYETLEVFSAGSLLRINLETGRTHQIRVHLSSQNHPLYGDALYGQQETHLINRQALHANRLILPQPRTGEMLDFKCDLPEDMQQLIKTLKTEV